MRHMPTLILVLAGAFYVNVAGAQSLQCRPPADGDWLLSTEQTKTIGGPGAPGSVRPFSLQVEGCGDVLIFTNLGENLTGNPKRFVRNKPDSNKYFYSTTITSHGITLPLTINLEQSDRFTMSGDWLLGAVASTHGTLTKVAPFQAPGSEKNQCDCKAFVDRLRDRVTDAEAWKSVYQNSKYIQRPADLSEFVTWNSEAMEHLITFVESDGVPFDTAVRDFKQLRYDHNHPSPASDSDGGPVATHHDAEATTDPRTCTVKFDIEPTGCAHDIIRNSTQIHENVHRDACLKQQAVRDQALKKMIAGVSWSSVISHPNNFAAQEVAGYTAEIKAIKSAYQNLCGKPLP